MFPALDFASGKANLDLWKRDPFLYGPCGHCAELLSFTENKDQADFSSYVYQNSSGYYTINLKGAKGTAVTLFGLDDFQKGRGASVCVQRD